MLFHPCHGDPAPRQLIDILFFSKSVLIVSSRSLGCTCGGHDGRSSSQMPFSKSQLHLLVLQQQPISLQYLGTCFDSPHTLHTLTQEQSGQHVYFSHLVWLLMAVPHFFTHVGLVHVLPRSATCSATILCKSTSLQ